ncbi:MAG: CCA tRNA nucleotidyltransferase, partial [Prevotella sp.]|nr:CCA tRNA nucleotidyltransferase [Prevotella sp.]
MRLLSDADLAKLLKKDIFRRISHVADALNIECYVVGGYVRDLFLERPSSDIDVVSIGNGSGISLARELKKDLGKGATISVFKNFGTAQVKYKDLEVEFVGARKESYSHDSRKPIVEEGTLEDDQNRRDFTINAMAICLNKEHFGHLVDPFYGTEDLQDGIVRTPLDPDITFSDDPLRMMRCVRFAAQLNFTIEQETFDALERNLDRIDIISGERIQEEFNKILLTPIPSKGMVDLYRSGLLEKILPEVTALDIVEKRGERAHKNNFYHTLEVLDNLSKNSDNLWLRWAALLHDIGKTKTKRWDNNLGWTFHNHNFVGSKMVSQIFRRLKMPLDGKMKYVEKLVELHMRPIVIADEEVTDSAVRRLLNDAGDDIDDLMLLCEADITSKNEVKKKLFLENFRIVRLKLQDLKEKDYKRLLQPCINGTEIMEMFNLKPSREVGILKQALKNAVLDNQVPNEREPLMK